MIDIIPILTQISEKTLLEHSEKYKKYAADQNLYLPGCGSKDCPTCHERNEMKESTLIEEFNLALLAINPERFEDGLITIVEKTEFPTSQDTTYRASIAALKPWMANSRSIMRPQSSAMIYTGTGTGRYTTNFGTSRMAMWGGGKSFDLQEQSYFADYIYRILDSIIEIERRIFLKYSSNAKAEALREHEDNKSQTEKYDENKIIRMMNVLQKAQTEEAWFKEEKQVIKETKVKKEDEEAKS